MLLQYMHNHITILLYLVCYLLKWFMIINKSLILCNAIEEYWKAVFIVIATYHNESHCGVSVRITYKCVLISTVIIRACININSCMIVLIILGIVSRISYLHVASIAAAVIPSHISFHLLSHMLCGRKRVLSRDQLTWHTVILLMLVATCILFLSHDQEFVA
jgi:hypothetical protein